MATDLASAIASLDEFELDLAEAHANFLATTGIILSFMGPFAVMSFLIQAIFGGVILGAIGGAIGIGALLTSDELRKRIQEVKNQCDASYYSSSGVCQGKYLYSIAHCLKITQNVPFEFLILAFSTNFCPFYTDLSGSIV